MLLKQYYPSIIFLDVIGYCGILSYMFVACLATVLLLFITGFCEHNREAYDNVNICQDSSDFCVEYVSTYIMNCKYGNTTQKFLVYFMYYSFLIILLILYFIATYQRKFKHAMICFPASLLSGIGIALIFIYDEHDITFKNNEVEFNGYENNPQFLHLLGVVLLFSMSGLIFIDIILYETIQINLQEDHRVKTTLRMMRDIDTGLDLFYIIALTGFVVTFFLSLAFVSIFFEYMVGLFFVLVFLVSFHFIKAKQDAIGQI